MSQRASYYSVILRNESPVGLLYGPEDVPYFNTPDRIEHWTPFPVVLRGGRPADLMRCPIGFNICTTRLREAIDHVLGPEDEIQWLELPGTFPDGHTESCWAMHFYTVADVLDREKTLWINDYPRRPVLDLQKATGRHLFKLQRLSPFFMVSGQMKRVMDRFDCSAYEFKKREVV